MKIAVTGHRPNKLGGEYNLEGPYSNYIRNEIETLLANWWVANKGNVTGISGMALGVDQLFAKICIEVGIPFIAAVPCQGQESPWPEVSRIRYHRLLERASQVYHVSTSTYSKDCMQKRNEWMVDQCDVLIAVWNGTPGGTKNCLDYAIRKDKLIARIDLEHIKHFKL
jgi:uncharacterized phage-like protein YoqJ